MPTALLTPAMETCPAAVKLHLKFIWSSFQLGNLTTLSRISFHCESNREPFLSRVTEIVPLIPSAHPKKLVDRAWDSN